MKIALYYPWIYLKSGIEKTILETVKRSRHNWTIFTSHYDKDQTFKEFRNLDIVELSKIPVERGYLKVLLAALKVCFQKINLSKYDALIVHSEGLGDLITLRNHSLPILCFCHTPIKVIHDPFMKGVYLKKNILKKPIFLLASNIFKAIDKIAWKNYKHAITISQEVKKRILNADLISKNHIHILPNGVNCKNITPTWKYDNYFLHPARLKWWKNIELSIEAFNIFCKKNNNFELIIAGQLDKRSEKYYNYLVKLSKNNKKIKIIPDPDKNTFRKLFQNSYATLSTTPNEDFGITIIEAMAYGKPVIAIDQGGPKEIIDNNVTGLLTPLSSTEMSKKLAYLADNKDIVLKMGQAAREASLRYNWEKIIDDLDTFIDELALP
ncbi:MAG: glycosyltransferase family 4 protein [Candidatus Omnitrophota bacterium]